MQRLTAPLKNERGIAVPLTALVLVAIVGMAALGLDTGRISNTANEVQNAADIAASAGAMAALRKVASPRNEAENVLGQNYVDGHSPVPDLNYFQIGNFTYEDGFVANGVPLNSARATVTSSVNNLLIKGMDALFNISTITRTATAAFRGAGNGRPTLPIVIGECHFQGDCFSQECMPVLNQVPDPDEQSAWTGFFDSASQAAITNNHFPPQCSGNGIGDVEIDVGDIINLTNGQLNPLLDNVDCMVTDLGINRFVIPIVPCESGFGSHPLEVLGFATIQIDSIDSQGSPKGINLTGIFTSSNPGSIGGGNFGTGSIALVE